jgi:hypothetical protein
MNVSIAAVNRRRAMKAWSLGVAFVVGSAIALGGSALPAWAAGPPALPWMSPNKVTNSVPVRAASISPCPPVPTAGDTTLVQINLSFGSGGGEAQILPTNPDGSWSGTVTFSFSGVNLRQTAINAECLDFNGAFGVPYAQYQNRHTQLFD